MSDQFMGEMRMISWNYPPRYWAFCDGAVVAISTNQALFSLLSNYYGGNGSTTFALPDLRARAAMGVSQATPLGIASGAPSVTLGSTQYPQHTHAFYGTKVPGNTGQPAPNGYLGSYTQAFGAVDPAKATNLEPSDIGATGGTMPHENRQPYLCLNFVIALSGIYPSRN